MKDWAKYTIIAIATALLCSLHIPSHTVSERTVMLTGRSHYLAVYVLKSHGSLTSIETYYSLDHYIHIDDMTRASNVRDVQMFICVNPESYLPNAGRCDDHISAFDDDSVGTLGQPHTSVHHNVTITFHPAGSGFSLHQGHFEHGGEPAMEFHYRDGFVLRIDMPSAPYLYSINMYRTSSGTSHAAFLAHDAM